MSKAIKEHIRVKSADLNQTAFHLLNTKERDTPQQARAYGGSSEDSEAWEQIIREDRTLGLKL